MVNDEVRVTLFPVYRLAAWAIMLGTSEETKGFNSGYVGVLTNALETQSHYQTKIPVAPAVCGLLALLVRAFFLFVIL